MPIIESADAILPKNNQNAPGKTIYREVVYSGVATDKRTLSDDDIREIFNNTKSYMLNKGLLVKVKITHDQEKTGDQEMKGFLRSMELHERSKEDGGGLSIWSKMHLYPETYKKWENGLFPEVSIGAFANISDRQGNELENVLDHVALYSVSRSALPELKTGTFASLIKTFTGLVEKLTSILPNKSNKNIGVYKKMEITPEEINALIASMGEIMATMQGWVEPAADKPEEEMATEDDKPKEEEEDKKEEMSTETTPEAITEPAKTELKANLKVTKYEAELKTELAELEYDKLFSAGKIVPDQKENFITLYKTNGKEFAKSFFGGMNIKTPPAGKQFKSDPDAGKGVAEARERLARLGMTNDPIAEKILKRNSNN